MKRSARCSRIRECASGSSWHSNVLEGLFGYSPSTVLLIVRRGHVRLGGQIDFLDQNLLFFHLNLIVKRVKILEILQNKWN